MGSYRTTNMTISVIMQLVWKTAIKCKHQGSTSNNTVNDTIQAMQAHDCLWLEFSMLASYFSACAQLSLKNEGLKLYSNLVFFLDFFLSFFFLFILTSIFISLFLYLFLLFVVPSFSFFLSFFLFSFFLSL